jgi:hypothetical protein
VLTRIENDASACSKSGSRNGGISSCFRPTLTHEQRGQCRKMKRQSRRNSYQICLECRLDFQIFRRFFRDHRAAVAGSRGGGPFQLPSGRQELSFVTHPALLKRGSQPFYGPGLHPSSWTPKHSVQQLYTGARRGADTGDADLMASRRTSDGAWNRCSKAMDT